MSKCHFIAGLLCTIVWVSLPSHGRAQDADPFAPDPFGGAPPAAAPANQEKQELEQRVAAEKRALADALEKAAKRKVQRARQLADQAREENNAELKNADAAKSVAKKSTKKSSIATFFGELIAGPTEQVMRSIQGRPAKRIRPPVADPARFVPPPVAVAVPARPVAEQLDPQAAQRKQQIDMYTQHFTQQLRPLLQSELQLIRQACDLPQDKRPPIKAAGEATIKIWATAMAEMSVGGRVRGDVVNFVGRNLLQDPRKGLREALAQAVKKEATAEQSAKYSELVKQQAAMRKQAAIGTVVSLLDDQLFLTHDQREKITLSITQGWQDNWENWLQINQYGGQYLPTMPADKVVPHLNEKQKQIFTTIPKVGLENNWNFGHQVRAQADDWWGADPPADPAVRNGGLFRIERQ